MGKYDTYLIKGEKLSAFGSEEARKKALESRSKGNPNFVSKKQIWQAIRAHCLECVGTYPEVAECDGETWTGKCPIHPYRFGKNVNDEKVSKNKLRQAIREMCKQCIGGFKCESLICQLKVIGKKKK